MDIDLGKDKLKILIVEDEFISRTLLKEMLNPYGDCDEVANGKLAIELFEKSLSHNEPNYDLVCLDIMMPEMNGHEVLQRLRRIEAVRGIDTMRSTKVMMVTALDDSRNIMEALMVGKCEAYLTKPVSKGKLEEQLRDLRLIDAVPTQ